MRFSRAARCPGRTSRQSRDDRTGAHCASQKLRDFTVRSLKTADTSSPPCLFVTDDGDRMARPRAAQPHRRVRHDSTTTTCPNGHVQWNRLPKPKSATRAGAHRTGHLSSTAPTFRQLRPLRVEAITPVVTRTWLRQGRRRMTATLLDADTIRAVLREAGTRGDRRCRHRASPDSSDGAAERRPRRAGDVSVQSSGFDRSPSMSPKPLMVVAWWWAPTALMNPPPRRSP